MLSALGTFFSRHLLLLLMISYLLCLPENKYNLKGI
jgi:hypothetical protein